MWEGSFVFFMSFYCYQWLKLFPPSVDQLNTARKLIRKLTMNGINDIVDQNFGSRFVFEVSVNPKYL